MRYSCYRRTSGGIRRFDFLELSAAKYLKDCESEVYEMWQERTNRSSDVSIANTLSRTIRPKFVDGNIGINPGISEEYGVSWMFQHRNDTSGKFLELYRETHKNRTVDFLLITQSREFKSKFLLDGSTMTFDSICDDYDEFVDILRPQYSIQLFIVVFEDMDFYVSYEERGTRTVLNLHTMARQ